MKISSFFQCNYIKCQQYCFMLLYYLMFTENSPHFSLNYIKIHKGVDTFLNMSVAPPMLISPPICLKYVYSMSEICNDVALFQRFLKSIKMLDQRRL